jgi:hypothetical protein
MTEIMLKMAINTKTITLGRRSCTYKLFDDLMYVKKGNNSFKNSQIKLP